MRSVRPIRPFAVRIHKRDDMHCGEPVIVLEPSNRKGYYIAVSLSNEGTKVAGLPANREVHISCLLRNRQSVNIARRVSRAYQKKMRLGG